MPPALAVFSTFFCASLAVPPKIAPTTSESAPTPPVTSPARRRFLPWSIGSAPAGGAAPGISGGGESGETTGLVSGGAPGGAPGGVEGWFVWFEPGPAAGPVGGVVGPPGGVVGSGVTGLSPAGGGVPLPLAPAFSSADIFSSI